jgi:hypothetical protein
MAPRVSSPTAAPVLGSPEPAGARELVLGGLRLALAALGTAAMITTLVQVLDQNGSVANYFSYFTILSNIFGVAVLCAGGFAQLRGTKPVPDYVRGAACLYLMITGVVAWTLLRNVALPEGNLWTNDVVHGVMPAAAVLDWLIIPPRGPLRLGRAGYWLVFPLVYLVYSLIRGPIVGWYPYPFLDPRSKGYAHVAVMSLVVTVAFLVFTALIVIVGNRLRARRAA